MSNKWLSSKNRKVHQRAMNKLMRQMNTNIKNDELWKGRFYVRQIASQWHEYDDHSGAELWVVLRFTDRKTGKTHEVADTVNHWRFVNGSHLFWAMNDFIVEKCDVWSEDPRPTYENAIDYRKEN